MSFITLTSIKKQHYENYLVFQFVHGPNKCCGFQYSLGWGGKSHATWYVEDEVTLSEVKKQDDFSCPYPKCFLTKLQETFPRGFLWCRFELRFDSLFYLFKCVGIVPAFYSSMHSTIDFPSNLSNTLTTSVVFLITSIEFQRSSQTVAARVCMFSFRPQSHRAWDGVYLQIFHCQCSTLPRFCCLYICQL